MNDWPFIERRAAEEKSQKLDQIFGSLCCLLWRKGTGRPRVCQGARAYCLPDCVLDDGSPAEFDVKCHFSAPC